MTTEATDTIPSSSPFAQSTTWLTLIATLAAIAHVGLGDGTLTTRVISIISRALAGVWALPDQSGGCATRMEDASLLDVGGDGDRIHPPVDSRAALPFLSVKITNISSLIAMGLTAAGYTLYRYTDKTNVAVKAAKAEAAAARAAAQAPKTA